MGRSSKVPFGAPEGEPPSSKRPMIEVLVDGAGLAGAGGVLIGGVLAVARMRRRRVRPD